MLLQALLTPISLFRALLSVKAVLLTSITQPQWPSQRYHTEAFAVPQFEVTRTNLEATENGFLFFGIERALRPNLRGPFIVSDAGELVWHGGTAFNAYYNTQVQTLHNKSVLSFWTGVSYSTHGYGSITIMDDTYTMRHQICLPESEHIVTPLPYPHRKCFIDKHESFITDRNTIVVVAYNATQANLTRVGGPENGWIYDCLFYELSMTNKVLFKWSALEHVDVSISHHANDLFSKARTSLKDYRRIDSAIQITTSKNVNKTGINPLNLDGQQTGFDQRTPWDFFHINSVQATNEGYYLVNSRLTWSFYFVDDQTGVVKHTLEGSNGGDFILRDAIFFSWQHHPRLQSVSEDKSTQYISLFNNDNIRNLMPNVNRSSGYLLSVNLTSKEVHQIRFLLDMSPSRKPIYANAEGSYQSLGNGHVLLAYGSEPFIQEFDAANNVIYTAKYGGGTANGVAGMHSYRVYRLPWHGQPTYPPKVRASVARRSDAIQIFMSWNGATTYTDWNILAGRFPEVLRPIILRTPKRGFETAYRITQKGRNHNYLMVQAVNAKGDVLANSSIIHIASDALDYDWLGL